MKVLVLLFLALSSAIGDDVCTPENCVTPDCSCFSTKSPIPGDPTLTPQIVVISFDDAITDTNFELYDYISQYQNPNGCNISMTFFVSHKYTQYQLANELHRRGHEIAVHSVSHSPYIEDYWVPGNYEMWEKEIINARDIMVKYGKVPKDDIKGFRAPFFVVGGDEMFSVLHDNDFKYDCSWPTLQYTNWYKPGGGEEPKGAAFPFTLDFAPILEEPTYGRVPQEKYPGLWVAPMLDLEDGRGAPCAMLDACLGPDFNCSTAECQDNVFQFLKDNFDANYFGNRAPFGLYSHESWFHTGEGQTHLMAYLRFLGYLSSFQDVWIVSMTKLIDWMANPSSLDDIGDFVPFQCPTFPPTSTCTVVTRCAFKVENENIPMDICGTRCPDEYPWLGDV